MNYVTADVVTDLLPNWNSGGDLVQTNRALAMANAWLSAKRLPLYTDATLIPEPILQAGAEVAALAFEDKLYKGRTEGVIKSKSVQAGSVSSSKTYVDGDAGLPVSPELQYALALLEPYLISGFAINTFAKRW